MSFIVIIKKIILKIVKFVNKVFKLSILEPPLLSVIMPVYNTEDYVEKAVNSICKATYKNLEIILVNDGSTDQSGKILDSLAKNDSRIVVVHQKNQGPAIARNNGIKLAKGKYLTFLDNDDAVNRDHYQYAISTLQKTKSDFSTSAYQVVNIDKKFHVPQWIKNANEKQILKTNLKKSPYIMCNIMAWSKIFRTKFYKKYVKGFTVGSLSDDIIPAMRGYISAKKFDILDNISVDWQRRRNKTSITQNMRQIKILEDRMSVTNKTLALLKNAGLYEIYKYRATQLLATNFFSPNVINGSNKEYYDAIRPLIIDFYNNRDDKVYLQTTPSYMLKIYQLIINDNYKEIIEFLESGAYGQFNWIYKYQNNELMGIFKSNEVLGIKYKTKIQTDIKSLNRIAQITKIKFDNEYIYFEFQAYLYGLDCDYNVDFYLGDAKIPTKKYKTEFIINAQHKHIDYSNNFYKGKIKKLDYVLNKQQYLTAHFNVKGSTVKTVIINNNSLRYSPILVKFNNQNYQFVSNRVTTYFMATQKEIKIPQYTNQILYSDVSVNGSIVKWVLKNNIEKPLFATISRKNYCKSFYNLSGNKIELELSVIDKNEPGFYPIYIPNGFYKIKFYYSVKDMQNDFNAIIPISTKLFDNKLPIHCIKSNSYVFKVEFDKNIKIKWGINSAIEKNIKNLYPIWQNILSHEANPINKFKKQFLMETWNGRNVSDSELAISKVIKQKYPDYKVIWSIENRSVKLSTDYEYVIRGSINYWNALKTSEYVCTNYNVPPEIKLNNMQKIVQTHHGHPFKSMGYLFAQNAELSENRILQFLKSITNLNVMLSTSPLATKLFKKYYKYTGKIIECGYPRNDAIVNVSDNIKNSIKNKLNIPIDKKVVLWCPTFRDNLLVGNKALMNDFIDPYKLAKKLGKNYFLIFRGHYTHSNINYYKQSAQNLLDATFYPEINDLINASDIGIFDYSSIRFDFLETNKPMIYFVPDIDEYFENRTPLFSYEDSIAGQKVKDYNQLNKSIVFASDVNQWYQKYGKKYKICKDTFCPWSNGHASEDFLKKLFDIKN